MILRRLRCLVEDLAQRCVLAFWNPCAVHPAILCKILIIQALAIQAWPLWSFAAGSNCQCVSGFESASCCPPWRSRTPI